MYYMDSDSNSDSWNSTFDNNVRWHFIGKLVKYNFLWKSFFETNNREIHSTNLNLNLSVQMQNLTFLKF